MPGMGTIVNTIAIFIGAGIGLLLKKGIPERFRSIIFLANGTSVLLFGIAGVLSVCLKVNGSGGLTTQYLLILLLSLLFGGVLGELIRIDRGFDRVGQFIEKKMGALGGDAAMGFASATILFCSGAMSIVGAIQDGTMCDPSLLYAKSVLDFVTALIFAAAYGPSVLFAGISVFVYQGSITLLSSVLQPLLSETVISQMSMAGSAILLLLAFSMWDIKKMNVANLIPATFMPLFINLVMKLF